MSNDYGDILSLLVMNLVLNYLLSIELSNTQKIIGETTPIVRVIIFWCIRICVVINALGGVHKPATCHMDGELSYSKQRIINLKWIDIITSTINLEKWSNHDQVTFSRVQMGPWKPARDGSAAVPWESIQEHDLKVYPDTPWLIRQLWLGKYVGTGEQSNKISHVFL